MVTAAVAVALALAAGLPCAHAAAGPMPPSSSSSSTAFLRAVPAGSGWARRRGEVVCKKAAGGGGGGGGAAKGFGFGAKMDPKVDKYKYTGRLKPGVVGASRLVPADIMRPDYALDGCVAFFFKCRGYWELACSPPQSVARDG